MRFRIGLGLAAVMGLAVRVAFVATRQSKVVLQTGDAYWYHFQAQLVADGRGFLNPFELFKNGVVTPGADHPPGFVLLLAAADKLGIDSAQGQRYLMCLFGTATIVVVGLLVRRLAGERAGLLAAVIAAVYPNFWINDGMLMVETLFMLAVAASLLFTYRLLAAQRAGGRILPDLLAVSACLTVAALVRPEALSLFAVVAVIVVWSGRDLPWRDRLGRLAAAAAVPILAFAPWAIYNQGRFEKPVPISTGAGQTLAVGNCDLTYSGDFLGFYDVQCILPPRIDPPTDLDASVRDPEYRTIAREYISHHKGELPKVALARVGRMWHLYRVDQGIHLDGWIEGRSGGPPGTGLAPVRAAVWSFYPLTLAAIAGTFVLHRRKLAVYPLLAHPLLATFTAATTFGVTRYRAGADVVTVVLAAVALDALVTRLTRGRRPAVPG